VVKSRKEFFPKGTNFIMDEVEEINAAENEVILKSG